MTGAANPQAVQTVSKALCKKKATAAQTESKQVQCDIFPVNPPLFSDAESFSRILSIKRVFFCPVYQLARAEIIIQKVFLADDGVSCMSQGKTVLLRELIYSDPSVFTSYLETLVAPKHKQAK